MALRPSILAAQSLRVLPRKRLSYAMGRLAELRGPGPLVDSAVRAFVRAYGVDMTEAEVPAGGFRSFDEFFTRRLRPGARPVDSSPDTLVSPCDGLLTAVGVVEGGEARLLVKGRPYRVAELIGSATDAEAFEGGQFALIYLAPKNYHRVHAPVSGPVERCRGIEGTLYPVNAMGIEHFPRLFAENERVVIAQRSADFGDVLTVMVGAIGVGRIGLSFDAFETNRGQGSLDKQYGQPGPALQRGDELGVFHLGSTVVLFTTSRVRLEWRRSPGEELRMGAALARRQVTV